MFLPARGGRPRPAGLHELLVASFLALLLFAAPCLSSEFTHSFDGITVGAGVLLRWENIEARHMPLTVRAVVINRTDDGRANMFQRNLTVGVNGTSWLWENMPSPLPYFPTGLYQVEVMSGAAAATATGQGGGNATVDKAFIFPKSPYFPILAGKVNRPSGTPGSETTSPAGSGAGAAAAVGVSAPSGKTISMVVGVIVGLVILLLVGTGCFCWRRRYVRARRAKRRMNKFDIVIH